MTNLNSPCGHGRGRHGRYLESVPGRVPRPHCGFRVPLTDPKVFDPSVEISESDRDQDRLAWGRRSVPTRLLTRPTRCMRRLSRRRRGGCGVAGPSLQSRSAQQVPAGPVTGPGATGNPFPKPIENVALSARCVSRLLVADVERSHGDPGRAAHATRDARTTPSPSPAPAGAGAHRDCTTTVTVTLARRTAQARRPAGPLFTRASPD
jgi:hypothetical protein